MSRSVVSKVAIGMLFAWALSAMTSCNPSNPRGAGSQTNNLPSGAKDEAIKYVEDYVKDKRMPADPCKDTDIGTRKDFQVKSATKADLSAADDANGLEEQWWVTVSFIYTCRGGNTWHDANAPVVVEKRSGSWKPRRE